MSGSRPETLHSASAELANPGFIDYQDGRTRRIQLSILMPGGPVRCGRIEFNALRNQSKFIYEAGYSGPPLDPINLPVGGPRRSFEVDPQRCPELLHRVFMDYMPGPWGQNILYTEFPYLRQYRPVEKLHWLGSRSVGSLAFHVDGLEDEQPVGGAQRLEEVRQRSVGVAMGRLSKVGDLEMDAGQGETPRWILEGLAAFGGARPKCTFRDRRGGHWLAKFNLEGDPYNCARVEHATALLARRAGIEVVQTRCRSVPGANDILFVRRFDRSDDRVSHKVSVFSLLPPEQAPRHSGGDYRMIFEVLEQLCSRPDFDRREMIRRMLFNVAVNNTDDHLRNFELVHDFATGLFELSPAFDITVDIYPNPRSTKVFGIESPDLDDETMQMISDRLHEPLAAVLEIRDEVLSVVQHWRPLFKAAGVNERDLKRLARVLDRFKA